MLPFAFAIISQVPTRLKAMQLTGAKMKWYTPQLDGGQLHTGEASWHYPNTATLHPLVSFPCRVQISLSFIL